MMDQFRLVVFDLDGVLTDGKFYFGYGENQRKTYSDRDLLGLKKLRAQEIQVGVITNDVSVDLSKSPRIYNLLNFVSASPDQDKLTVLTRWKDELGIEWKQVAYMGDDEPDIPCMSAAGLSGAPNDAVDAVQAVSDFVSPKGGGNGAVRSFCEYLLEAAHTPSSACICVPARLASFRLPSKLLLEIDGVAIIRRTCLQCIKTGLPVFVFTGDKLISDSISDIVTVVHTPGEYENGTERLSRNSQNIPPEFNTIINVQGDEPFVLPENILHALKMHEHRGSQTFYTTLHEECDESLASNPARVKVAVSGNRAQWYSRSPIPYQREGKQGFNIFTGIYVWCRDKLALFSELPDTPCQIAESVEQLKVLEHGFHIATYSSLRDCAPSIDTIDDFLKASAQPTPLISQPAVKSRLLDCTLRDGGYINNWMFSDDFVQAFLPIVTKIADVVEVGFINRLVDYRSCPIGKYRHLSREDLKLLRPSLSCSLSVMADFILINRDVVFPKNYDIDMVRLAFGKADVSKAKVLAEELIAHGYDVSLNFMSSHLYTPRELATHAMDVVDAIPYVVDSLGCMSTKQVQEYMDLLPKKAGLHVHNNLQQAVGTYAQIPCGIADATFFGMGRGAGNLPLELCDIPLESRAEILNFYDKHMKNIPRSWGYAPEFIMQAHLNCHPNYVVKMMDMGIGTDYIIKLLKELKDYPDFDLEKLRDICSSHL